VGVTNVVLGAFSVSVAGNTVYVAGTSGNGMIDVSNPLNPVLIDITSPSSRDVEISGNYGISTSTNALNIFDARAAITNGACAGVGKINYNTTSNVLEFCDGSVWKTMGDIPGAGGSGCTSPAGGRGALDFYSTTNRYRYCDGTNWITID